MPILLVVLVTIPAVIIAAVAIFTKADELPVAGSQYVAGVALLTTLVRREPGPAGGVARPPAPHDLAVPVPSAGSRASTSSPRRPRSSRRRSRSSRCPSRSCTQVVCSPSSPCATSSRAGWAGIWTAALYAVLLALLALAICAWIVRRGFGIAAVVVTLFLSVVVVGILANVIAYDAENNDTPVPTAAILVLAFAPLSLIDGLRSWIVGDRPDDATSSRTPRPSGRRTRSCTSSWWGSRCLPSCGATARCRCHERPGAGAGLTVVRQRRRRQRRVDDPRSGRHRSAGSQRRRQVDAHQHDVGLPRSLVGIGHPRRRAGVAPRAGLPLHRAGPRDRGGHAGHHRVGVRRRERPVAGAGRPRGRGTRVRSTSST